MLDTETFGDEVSVRFRDAFLLRLSTADFGPLSIGGRTVKVTDILQSKGNEVHCITPRATLADVVKQLVDCNCGSLLVCDEDQVLGIITERDILRASAMDGRPLMQISVRERMTSDLVTATSEDRVADVMGLLTSKRVRHLPIVDEGRLAGIISIGDVVKAQHDQVALENHYLKSYIHS